MWFWVSFILLGLFVYLPIGVIIWGAIASLSAKSSWNNVISTFTANPDLDSSNFIDDRVSILRNVYRNNSIWNEQ